MNNYQIAVTEEELKLIFKGLGKLPFENVFELIEKLNLQLIEQKKTRNNEEG